eukprot:961535-Amphidinium_carterae.2
MRNFRNRINRVNNDENEGNRPSGRDGGDGGYDPDQGPASSTGSQAGDGYGPRRWHTAQKTKRLELFKQRKTLPKLVLAQNWKTMQPALRDRSSKTGRPRAHEQGQTPEEMFLDSSPTERARLEKQYILGDSNAVTDPHNHFESILRVELLEQIPEFM